MSKAFQLAGISMGCVLITCAAAAAEGDAPKEKEEVGQLEAVVVTANRREQRIQDVGVAVRQFSADDLRAIRATDTKDIAQLVPGVFVAGAYGGQSQQFTIRGVVQSDYLDTIENPVAFYIDDIYVVSAQSQTMSFYDVDRVEILKGPQGTLFGRNATGGLVHTLVNEPQLGEFEGFVDGSYARFDEIIAKGALNIPIGESAALRASVLYSRVDDYWTNRFPAGAGASDPILSFDGPGGNSEGVMVEPNGDDLGGDETNSARLQFLVEPNEALSIRLTASYSKTDMSISPYTQEATIAIVDDQGRVINEQRVSPTETRLAINPDGSNYTGPTVIVPVANGILERPVAGGNFFGYIPFDPDDLDLSEDFAQSDHDSVDSQIYGAHIDYDFGGALFSSITSFQDYSKEVYLGDGSAANVLGFGADSETEAWSQEFRLAGETERTRWQVGAFYLDNEVDLLQGILEPTGSALANLGTVFTGNPILVEIGSDLVTDVLFTSESISLFGQVEYDLADKWTLIVGARAIQEDQEYHYRHYTAANLDNYKVEGDIFVVPAFQPDYDDSRTEDMWTGKLQIEYRPNEDLLWYAGLHRGVKAGNYNAPFTFSPFDAIPDDAMSYDPEQLTSLEGGFKFGRGPVLFNASAFYYDYDDFQAFVFTTASGVVRNVDSEVYGVDLDAGYQVTDSLHLGATFAYSHAQIDDFEIAPGVFRTVRPPYAPREQAAATVDYVLPADVFNGELSFNAVVNYAGKIYHNIRNFDSQEFDARTLVNASVTWTNESSDLYVQLFGTNIFDERYAQIGFDNTTIFGGQNVSFGKPAGYGVAFGVKF